jgi:hypothetical protein
MRLVTCSVALGRNRSYRIGRSFRRLIVLMCGIVLLVDGAGMYAALGLFDGNEIIFSSAATFLAGAALFSRATANRSP